MAGIVLRIPKAASSSLVRHLQRSFEIPDHEFSLAGVPPGWLAFAIVRDPVDRFRSGYDMYHRNRHGEMPARFPTVDDFVDAGPEEWRDAVWGSAFWPQTWWLISASYVQHRGAIVMHYDTFADDMVAMGLGRPRETHVCPSPSTVGAAQQARLRDYYADDIELIRRLGYG